MAEKPKYEQPEAYQSQYQGQMDSALSAVTNREKFSYDPLKDANYQAMAKLYQTQGEKAAKNTLGDAAALNGGYGSSYALTASQQVRNDYNQQLASQIPALSDAAYNRYINEQNLNLSTLDALRAADDTLYGRYRDNVGDMQYRYGIDYDSYRDDIADSQWQKSYDRSVYESDRDFNYQKERDAVADSQWAQQFALSKKASNGSYSGNYIGNSSSDDKMKNIYLQAQEEAEKKTNKKNAIKKAKTALNNLTGKK